MRNRKSFALKNFPERSLLLQKLRSVLIDMVFSEVHEGLNFILNCVFGKQMAGLLTATRVILTSGNLTNF